MRFATEGAELEVDTVVGVGRSRRTKRNLSDCPICSQRDLGGGEIFVLAGEAGISIYDTEQANTLVADGRFARPVPPEALQDLLKASHVEREHLAHVNPDRPGLIARRMTGPFILDGIHRAARSLEEHGTFSAFFLSQEETQSCLLSQDIGETDVALAAKELRKLIAQHPDESAFEIFLDADEKAIQQIRKFLTEGEKKRIKISRSQGRDKE